MVAVSGNTDSAPLIGSKVAYFGVTRLMDPFGSKVRRQIKCKVRPVRGESEVQLSEKALYISTTGIYVLYMNASYLMQQEYSIRCPIHYCNLRTDLLLRISGMLNESVFDLLSSGRVVEHMVSLSRDWISGSKCQSLQNYIIRHVKEEYPARRFTWSSIAFTKNRFCREQLMSLGRSFSNMAQKKFIARIHVWQLVITVFRKCRQSKHALLVHGQVDIV